jgi:hypothetical protein
VMPLVGRHGSVRLAHGCAVRGDGVLGVDVGARAVGPAIAAVPRRRGLARGAGAFQHGYISGLPYSTAIFSKKLN